MEQSILKILYLEDWIVDVELVKRELQSANIPFTMQVVATRVEYEQALKSFVPDVVLSDHTLASFNSREALTILKQSGLNVPFVIVTGMMPEHYATEILNAGAFDFLLKDQLKRLPKTVMNAVEMSKMTEERKTIQDQRAEIIKSNKELDRFVYNASHDMRAPLASLLGLIELVESENNEVARKHITDLMRMTIHGLEGMLQDMVDYSRNMRQEIECNLVDFEDLFSKSMSQLRYMEGAEKITCTLSYDSRRDFYSDPKRLMIVLNNLLSNSIKYHNLNQALPFIKVRVAVGDQGARMEVEDNGIGISSNVVHKIFDMFFRATDVKTGSGLGLFIVREIVEKLDGYITVTSSVGQGSTFVVELPHNRAR